MYFHAKIEPAEAKKVSDEVRTENQGTQPEPIAIESTVAAANRRLLEMFRSSSNRVIGPIAALAAIVSFSLTALPDALEVKPLALAYIWVLILMLTAFMALLSGWFSYIFLWISLDERKALEVSQGDEQGSNHGGRAPTNTLTGKSCAVLYFIFGMTSVLLLSSSIPIAFKVGFQLLTLLQYVRGI
jgi:hypothetical protein